MNNHSFRQQQYLFRLKRDRILIHAFRLLLLAFFLFFWETASRKQWIDSFIFSSPSLLPGNLCKNVERTISYLAYPHHTVRNPDQLFSCNEPWYLKCSDSMAFPKNLQNPGTLPGGSEQPAKIRTCSTSYCLAGCQRENYYCIRHIRRHLRLYSQPVYRLYRNQPGKAETDTNPWGWQNR